MEEYSRCRPGFARQGKTSVPARVLQSLGSTAEDEGQNGFDSDNLPIEGWTDEPSTPERSRIMSTRLRRERSCPPHYLDDVPICDSNGHKKVKRPVSAEATHNARNLHSRGARRLTKRGSKKKIGKRPRSRRLVLCKGVTQDCLEEGEGDAALHGRRLTTATSDSRVDTNNDGHQRPWNIPDCEGSEEGAMPRDRPGVKVDGCCTTKEEGHRTSYISSESGRCKESPTPPDREPSTTFTKRQRTLTSSLGGGGGPQNHVGPALHSSVDSPPSAATANQPQSSPSQIRVGIEDKHGNRQERVQALSSVAFPGHPGSAQAGNKQASMPSASSVWRLQDCQDDKAVASPMAVKVRNATSSRWQGQTTCSDEVLHEERSLLGQRTTDGSHRSPERATSSPSGSEIGLIGSCHHGGSMVPDSKSNLGLATTVCRSDIGMKISSLHLKDSCAESAVAATTGAALRIPSWMMLYEQYRMIGKRQFAQEKGRRAASWAGMWRAQQEGSFLAGKEAASTSLAAAECFPGMDMGGCAPQGGILQKTSLSPRLHQAPFQRRCDKKSFAGALLAQAAAMTPRGEEKSSPECCDGGPSSVRGKSESQRPGTGEWNSLMPMEKFIWGLGDGEGALPHAGGGRDCRECRGVVRWHLPRLFSRKADCAIEPRALSLEGESVVLSGHAAGQGSAYGLGAFIATQRLGRRSDRGVVRVDSVQVP
ncbi:unnamed protein product [Ostreobium quekettii]|uniref:Uncharacterized protein n=1 Tax=Ostreobium quekettii TaxID=121088 RepID=A0A8S1J9X0_9CHLO|nr:unnamed protein product [Ostreobium quekettii]